MIKTRFASESAAHYIFKEADMSISADNNTSNGYFKVIRTFTDNSDYGKAEARAFLNENRLEIAAVSDKAFTADRIGVELSYDYLPDDKIFVNGFQSWTDSREYSAGEKMYAPSLLAKAVFNSALGKKKGLDNAGDRGIASVARKKGLFYGISYGYVRRESVVDLFGSLSERSGYTVIEFDVGRNTVTLTVDVKGKLISAGTTVITSVVRINDEYDKAFDGYFRAMGIKPVKRDILNGYTTWYNYYGNIDSKIVERDLAAISKLDCKVDIFQIDDGYQADIGDWLNRKEDKFPEGMKELAQKIHSRNMLAGLWLAPFAAGKNSFIGKRHPDWLLKDESGRPLTAGANWGGFYALDIYNAEARAYIEKVFRTVLFDWGYDLVKLDFLYCAALVPLHGKSRGEIMCDAVDLLRECCKDKLILGCGVPLAPAFGKFDYCRIGPDLGLKWGKNRMDTREGVSTSHAILNSVFRRHLNNRAFGNDPDVFLLRDKNIKLTESEKNTVSVINKLCGSVLFTSDNIQEYSDDKIKHIGRIFDKNSWKLLEADICGNRLSVIYEAEGEKRRLDTEIY